MSCEQCILQQCGLDCLVKGTCESGLHVLIFQCLVFTCGTECWGWQPPNNGGGDKDVGTCCTVNQTPGCSNQTIEQCVCAQDGYCCNSSWDATCVSEVTSYGCGTCPP